MAGRHSPERSGLQSGQTLKSYHVGVSSHHPRGLFFSTLTLTLTLTHFLMGPIGLIGPIRLISQGQFHHIDNGTTDGSDGKESQATPRRHNTDNESHQTGEGRHRRLHNTRERHHGKSDVGHVVEKTAYEAMAYLTPDQHDGKHTDEIRGDDGQSNANYDITRLHLHQHQWVGAMPPVWKGLW